MVKLDSGLLLRMSFKYLLEGIVIAICAFYIPMYYKNSLRQPTVNEIFGIALTGALTMLVLDLSSPQVATGARLGSGFGIGMNLVK